MPGAKRLPATTYVQGPHWEYLGGELLEPTDAVAAQATLPSTCTIVVISVETQGTYYEINSPHVSASSPGYIPEDVGAQVIGPLANLNTLRFLGDNATAADVHLQYFRET
jgi:hypothetical protein